jgi:biotin transport system substrate-specific component
MHRPDFIQSYTQVKNHSFVLSFMGVVLLSLSAQICIPLHPVPISLQSTAAILLGLIYTPRHAFYSTSTYLLCGALGFPIFAGGCSGPWELFGTDGGYLFGLAFAATFVAWIKTKWQAPQYLPYWLKIQLIALSGTVIIFLCGVPWLAVFIGIEHAVQFGLLPFILPGIVKNMLMGSAVSYLKPRI